LPDANIPQYSKTSAGISPNGGRTPKIVARRDITKGKDHWLSSSRRKELFGTIGVTDIRTYLDPQRPNHVAVSMDVPDLEAMKALIQTGAAAEAMEFDGVVPESLVILIES
jgi:hypothetical protein